MTMDNSTIQILLEDPNVSNATPYFIGEEIICTIPEDIEVIPINNHLPEPNFYKPSPVKKRPRVKKQPLSKVKQKRTAVERAEARASKIQPFITLPEPEDDSFIDFNGLKVPVKTLLQNEEIRKQLEPFIEEIIISDVSDTSDIEEICQIQKKKSLVTKRINKPFKPRSKKRKKSPEPIVNEGAGPFVEVLIPEAADCTQSIEKDIIVNLPLAVEKDAIKDTQENYPFEQIQFDKNSSDDEHTIKQNTNECEQTLLKEVNADISKNGNSFYKKIKAAKTIQDSEVVILDDEREEIAKEASIIESDDWYYLNMPSTSKTNTNLTSEALLKVDNESTATGTLKVDNNSAMTIREAADDNLNEAPTLNENDEKSTNYMIIEEDTELDQDLSNNESDVQTAKPRRRKKRRRIPWSRHAIRGTRVSKNIKAKLQDKVVRGSIKTAKNASTNQPNVNTKSQNTITESKNDKSLSAKSVVNNLPTSIFDKTRSILDKTNINHNSSCTKETPVMQEKKSVADSSEVKLAIKQEPMLENNDETTAELRNIYQSNKEMDENQLHIKLEQEVGWNTDVNYQNSYQEMNLKQRQLSDELLQENVATQQKRSKLIAKRLVFGRKRSIGKCDNCGKGYKRLEALRRHQLMCKVSYNCAMCTFLTSDKIAFREHLANHIVGSANNYQEEKQTNGPTYDSIAPTIDLADPNSDSIVPAIDLAYSVNDSVDLDIKVPADNLTNSSNDSIDLSTEVLTDNLTNSSNNLTDLVNDSTDLVKDSTSPANNGTSQTGIDSIRMNHSTPAENQQRHKNFIGYTECYRCKICKHLFDDYASLRKHILLSLQGAQIACLQKGINRCNRCGVNGFLNKCELRCHMVTTCASKKIIKIPYIKLERCKIPEKSKIVTPHTIKYHCLKCSTTNTGSDNLSKCKSCQSKLSFMCQICGGLSTTCSKLREHMSCAHNVDLYDYTNKLKVLEKKCLSEDKEKSSKENMSSFVKKYTTLDTTGSTKGLKHQVPGQFSSVNTINTSNMNKPLNIYSKADQNDTQDEVVEATAKSEEMKPLKSYSKTDQNEIQKQVVEAVTKSEEIKLLKTLKKKPSKIDQNEIQKQVLDVVANSKEMKPLKTLKMKPFRTEQNETQKQIIKAVAKSEEMKPSKTLELKPFKTQKQVIEAVAKSEVIKPLKTYSKADKNKTHKQAVQTVTKSDEVGNVLLTNNVNSVPVINEIPGVDEKANQSQKQMSGVKIKTIKIMRPVKQHNTNSIKFDKKSMEIIKQVVNQDKQTNKTSMGILIPFSPHQIINTIPMKVVQQVVNPIKQINKTPMEIDKQVNNPIKQINKTPMENDKRVVSPTEQINKSPMEIVKQVVNPIEQIQKKQVELVKEVISFNTITTFLNHQSDSKNIYDFDQYLKKVETSGTIDGVNCTEKFINRKLESSTIQNQYLANDNGAFEKNQFKSDNFKSSKRNKLGLKKQIIRFCMKCDKTKKYNEKIKMGLTIEICRKCKTQLLYQCKDCHGLLRNYQKMAWHVIHKCKPRLRYFSVSQKEHLRKILEERYALLEAQQDVFDSIEFES